MGASPPVARTTKVIGFLAVVAALHLAQGVLIPVALAGLIALVLLPLVKRLARLGLGQAQSVLTATAIALLLAIAFGWMVTSQVADLASKLPQYRSNIVAKASSFGPAGDYVERTWVAIQRLGDEIVTSTEKSAAAPTPEGPAAPRLSPPPAINVRIVDPPTTPLQAASRILVAWAEDIGKGVVVLILVAFLLIYRIDLGDRLILVFGRASANVTTQTINEAAGNVSRYLVTLSMVNAGFGLAVTACLLALGVPNAVLWGLLAALGRFIPFVGVWIALIAPFVLSLAVFDGWTRPLVLLGLWLVLEIVAADVVEPLVYGKRTNVSPLGVMLGALFWTWLWGPVGLILAMPMTVSIFVLGRSVPQLAFLSTLFGSDTVLEPRMQIYHRLLGQDSDAAAALVDGYRKGKSFVDVCDALFLPALALFKTDRLRGDVDDDRAAAFLDNLRSVIEDAGDTPPDAAAVAPSDAAATPPTPAPPATQSAPAASAPAPAPAAMPVLIVPAANDADELVALILERCLATSGIAATRMPARATTSEHATRAAELGCSVVILSALHPTSTVAVRQVARRIRMRCPDARIVIGVWTAGSGLAVLRERIAVDAGTRMVSTLADAMTEIREPRR